MLVRYLTNAVDADGNDMGAPTRICIARTLTRHNATAVERDGHVVDFTTIIIITIV